jgi:predicted DCC family thiol-disulfide oxidoreductase YuxK
LLDVRLATVTTPVLVFDDDCGFCTWWAEFLAARSDITLVGYTDVGDDLREGLPEGWRQCSHLVTDEGVYSCGRSIEEAFARSEFGAPARPVIDALGEFGPYNDLRERGYRWVAENRSVWGRVLSKTPPVRRNGTEE